MSAKLQRLQQVLGYPFKDKDLLLLALTHRSCGPRNNERLEFLGDSVLNHIVAEALFQRFPDAREGDLSRMRASLVQGETLAKVARELGLGEYLKLGSGEMKSGGSRRASILADTLESILGAILMDANIEACRARVFAWFEDRLEGVSPEGVGKDAKTTLQEKLQARGKRLPDYQLTATTGEDHCQQFTVTCALADDGKLFTGEGSSRRRAEQAAAQAALEELYEQNQR
jgi:ribonuclease-3